MAISSSDEICLLLLLHFFSSTVLYYWWQTFNQCPLFSIHRLQQDRPRSTQRLKSLVLTDVRRQGTFVSSSSFFSYANIVRLIHVQNLITANPSIWAADLHFRNSKFPLSVSHMCALKSLTKRFPNILPHLSILYPPFLSP